MKPPLWRTDKRAAQGLALPVFVEAGLVAWLVPPVLGYIALVSVRWFGTDTFGLAGLGYILMMSVVFSLIGIVPGVAAIAVLLRKGFGGLGPTLLVGLAMSALLSLLATGFDSLFQILFLTTSLFYAAFTWIYLYLRKKECILPV